MKTLRKPGMKIRKMLAENIVYYRHSHNISQEKLAEICGLHRTYIGSVERCERNVTLSTLEAIATALNTSVPQLLTKRKSKNDAR
jgi:transcriptional regulator with XRE-family HTH domain